MLPSSSVTSSIPSASLAAPTVNHAGNAETPTLLEALSIDLESPVMVHGLPGFPVRAVDVEVGEHALGSPSNLTHLVFYPSNKTGHMTLVTHLIRNGRQMAILDATLPADDNLLFRAAATAKMAAHNRNQNTPVASDAATFELRRAIERKLHPAMNRSIAMDSVAHVADTERAAAITNLRDTVRAELERDRWIWEKLLTSQHPIREERIGHEHGMRRLTTSPELPAVPAATLVPNKTGKRSYPF